ncbi:protein translocase subunit SecD [Candidatus Berkelbacteria bacterium]|nr:protein translocase subunit SecD [Candidatus Berkelbacteria bacterium]
MRRRFWVALILIFSLIALAGYISYPTTTKIFNRDVTLRQGLDLQGGVQLKYELDLSKVEEGDQAQATESARKVVESRVNSTGVAEPVIQPTKIGEKSAIIVELPGIKDINQAINLIGKTAQLQFKELIGEGEQAEWRDTKLTGKQLDRASVSFDQNTNAPQISLQFNPEGDKLFAQITERNIGKPVGIFLDDELLSYPNVNERISGGQAVITGQFTIQEVKQIVNLLNAGALEVPIKLVEQRTIGATLGVDSIKKSLVAGVLGLVLVIVFMVMNYRIAGIVASIALVAYSLITIALFKYVPVTLTLAGIAGFILSIGMAVDANILIFERMREELRDGREVKSALEESFKRAWPSVRDSNVSTLITCVILYTNTSGLVRGFALTLALGVIVSLFSSITTSRALMRLLTLNKKLSGALGKI